MEPNTEEILKMTKNVDSVKKFGQMDQNIKDNT